MWLLSKAVAKCQNGQNKKKSESKKREGFVSKTPLCLLLLIRQHMYEHTFDSLGCKL